MIFYKIITFPIYIFGFISGFISNAYYYGNNRGKDVYYCITESPRTLGK